MRRGARGGHRWVSATLAAAQLTVVSLAAAAPRVVLISRGGVDAATREATTRMRAELVAAGFEVAEATATTDLDPRAQVERTAEREHAFATILIVPARTGAAAEVWVADHLTSKTLVRRVEAKASRDVRPPSALAIRALELLRASLLETQTDAQSSGSESTTSTVPAEVSQWMQRPAPKDAPERDMRPSPGTSPSPGPPLAPELPPPSRAPMPAPPLPPSSLPAKTEATAPEELTVAEAPQRPWAGMVDHFALEAGAGVLYSAGAARATAVPTARAWIHVTSGLSVRLAFSGPAFGPDLRSAEGTASIQQELATAGIAYAFPTPVRWLVPIISIGAGAYHLHVQGAASPPFRTASGDAWTALVDASVGLGARVTEHVAFTLCGHGLLAAPRPLVAIGDTSTGAGPPGFMGELTGVVSF